MSEENVEEQWKGEDLKGIASADTGKKPKSDDKVKVQVSGFLGKKLLFQAIIMIGLVGGFWFIGEVTADYIIGMEITWLRVSSISGLVICFGLILSAVIVDWLTDRIYTRYVLK